MSTEETLNKVHNLIRDDKERKQRFGQLMERLSVPMENQVAYEALNNLSDREKAQAEEELISIFQYMGSMQEHDQSQHYVAESGQVQLTTNPAQDKKPKRPIRMRGLSI